MIKIDYRQYFYDRIWFGFVFFTKETRRSRRFLFLGWDMFFIPCRLRMEAPPFWYLKAFKIDYF